MKSSFYISLAVQSLFFIFVHITHSLQLCSPPDVPRYGNYHPKQNNFQPGDKVFYNCSETYTLMGKETSKCTSKGDWSNPTPFCDLKSQIRSPMTTNRQGHRVHCPEIADGNTSTCSSINTGEFIKMTLDRPASMYAVRLFLKRGVMAIESGFSVCSNYTRFIDINQWVLLECRRNMPASNYVKVQEKSDKNSITTICEIEVYVKEDGGCDRPPGPERRVTNGYFEVTRTMAKLICETGYQSDSGSDRLVCENNDWVRNRLQCNEILCNPVINVPVTPGSEWIFLDSTKKISAGTRRQLKCSDGYVKTGNPDTVVCQKNGTWTNTNATCTEVTEAKMKTKTIIIGAVAGVVVLIIITLFAITIYFVRKQRREVVVVYKTPTDGSVISGSEPEYASIYYESIKGSAPQPPTSSRPTVQMISEGYFLPLDSQDSLKNQPTPVDIAFGTLKQSTLYR